MCAYETAYGMLKCVRELMRQCMSSAMRNARQQGVEGDLC